MSQQRMEGYDLPVYNIPVPPTPSAKTAFLIRVRSDSLNLATTHAETLMHLRSIVSELQSSDMDVYFVVDSSREFRLSRVAPDLAARIFTFTLKDFASEFPARTFASPLYDNHASLSAFMESAMGQQYSFSWWLEEDVRSTASWAAVLQNIRATIPKQDPEPYDWELRQAQTARGDYKPDLILTWLEEGLSTTEDRLHDRNGGMCSTWAEPEELAKTYIQLHGVSRRMHDAMMNEYRQGHSCYVEYFIPTVAKRARFPIHVAQLPVFTNALVDKTAWVSASYNSHVETNRPTCSQTWGTWQKHASTPFYRDWMINDGICRPGPAIMHKVNLKWRA